MQVIVFSNRKRLKNILTSTRFSDKKLLVGKRHDLFFVSRKRKVKETKLNLCVQATTLNTEGNHQSELYGAEAYQKRTGQNNGARGWDNANLH